MDDDGASADYAGVHEDEDEMESSSPIRSYSPPPLPSRSLPTPPTPPALKLFISPPEAAVMGKTIPASPTFESDAIRYPEIHAEYLRLQREGQQHEQIVYEHIMHEHQLDGVQQRLQQQRSSSTDSSDSFSADKTVASSSSSSSSAISKASPISSSPIVKVEANAKPIPAKLTVSSSLSSSKPNLPSSSSSSGSSKLVANMLSQPAMSHPNDAFLQLLRLQQEDAGRGADRRQGDAGKGKEVPQDEDREMDGNRDREVAAIIGSIVDPENREGKQSKESPNRHAAFSISSQVMKEVNPSNSPNPIPKTFSSVTTSTRPSLSSSFPSSTTCASLMSLSNLQASTVKSVTMTMPAMSTGVKTIPATLVLKREVTPGAHLSATGAKTARLDCNSSSNSNKIDLDGCGSGDGPKLFDDNHSYAKVSHRHRAVIQKNDETSPSPHHLSHLSLQRSQQPQQQTLPLPPPPPLPQSKLQLDNAGLMLRDNGKLNANENQHSILIFSAGPTLQSAYPTSSPTSSSIQQRQMLLHHQQQQQLQQLQQCQKDFDGIPGSSLQRLNPSTLHSFATTSNEAASSPSITLIPTSSSSSIAMIPSSSSLLSSSVILPAHQSDTSTNVDSVAIASIMAGQQPQQQLQRRQILLSGSGANETAANVSASLPTSGGSLVGGVVSVDRDVVASDDGVSGIGSNGAVRHVVCGGSNAVIGSNGTFLAGGSVVNGGGVIGGGGGGVVAATAGASGEIQLLLLPTLTFVQSADGKLVPAISSQPQPPQQAPQPSPSATPDFQQNHSNVVGPTDVFLSAQHQMQNQQPRQQYQYQQLTGKSILDVSGGIPPRHFLASTADGQRVLFSADALPASHPLLAAQEQQQQQHLVSFGEKATIGGFSQDQPPHSDQSHGSTQCSYIVAPPLSTDIAAPLFPPNAASSSPKELGDFYATNNHFAPPTISSGEAFSSEIPPQALSQSSSYQFPTSVAPPPLPLSTERTIAENVSLLYAQLCKYPLDHVTEIRASQLKSNVVPNRKILSLEPKFVILKHQEFMEDVLHSVVQFAKGIPGWIYG